MAFVKEDRALKIRGGGRKICNTQKSDESQVFTGAYEIHSGTLLILWHIFEKKTWRRKHLKKTSNKLKETPTKLKSPQTQVEISWHSLVKKSLLK